MRYIRTKDGVYETTGGFAYPDETIGNILNGIKALEVKQQPRLIMEDKIINQADTIEELCDYQLALNQNGEIIGIFTSLKALKEIIKEKCVVFGCILTSKGLIYVAKMNSKGELELC